MKYYATLIIATAIISLHSCRPKCHEGGDEVHENYNASFYIINASNSTSIYSSQTHQSSCDSIGEYCADSLKLFDVNFNPIPISYSASGGSGPYYFYNLPIYNESIDNLAKSQIISKKFYLRLNYFDTDTIEIKYALEEVKKCPYYNFRDQQALYNNKPVDITNGGFGLFYFKK